LPLLAACAISSLRFLVDIICSTQAYRSLVIKKSEKIFVHYHDLSIYKSQVVSRTYRFLEDRLKIDV